MKENNYSFCMQKLFSLYSAQEVWNIVVTIHFWSYFEMRCIVLYTPLQSVFQISALQCHLNLYVPNLGSSEQHTVVLIEIIIWDAVLFHVIMCTGIPKFSWLCFWAQIWHHDVSRPYCPTLRLSSKIFQTVYADFTSVYHLNNLLLFWCDFFTILKLLAYLPNKNVKWFQIHLAWQTLWSFVPSSQKWIRLSKLPRYFSFKTPSLSQPHDEQILKIVC